MKLQLRDPDGQLVREAHLTSSHFGIVHHDIDLPDTSALGSYRLRVEKEQGGGLLAVDSIRVGRYELPAFSVRATAGRTYYLPGQEADIDISTAYLFGKPVPGAAVRVVQDWKTHDVSYPVTVAEGPSDDLGRFRARLYLSPDHAELAGRLGRRFKDLPFAVYSKDPASGRTEQTRLVIRISREPVHVYVRGGLPDGGPLPVPVYVSTWYADGTPAETTVSARWNDEEVLSHTNRHGFAKLMLKPSSGTLDIDARDGKGLRGQRRQSLAFDQDATLRVTAARSVLRQAEPVALRVQAPDDDLELWVNATSIGRAVASRRIRLQQGGARVEFPYQPEFQRVVRFTAYSGDRAWAARPWFIRTEPPCASPRRRNASLTNQGKRLPCKSRSTALGANQCGPHWASPSSIRHWMKG